MAVMSLSLALFRYETFTCNGDAVSIDLITFGTKGTANIFLNFLYSACELVKHKNK